MIQVFTGQTPRKNIENSLQKQRKGAKTKNSDMIIWTIAAKSCFVYAFFAFVLTYVIVEGAFVAMSHEKNWFSKLKNKISVFSLACKFDELFD